MTARRLAVPVLATLVLFTACGRLNRGGGDPAVRGIDHPTGPSDLVLRWEYVGGFTSPEILLTRLPSFSLYGDGSLVTEGPQIEIYPGPALPNLVVRHVSEEGIQAILAAARDAGLTAGDATYANPCVADAPDTRFTVVAAGRTSVVTASALGVGGGDCQGSDPEAMKRLSAFVTRLGNLEKWLPDGSLGVEASYTPTGLRVYVRDYVADPQLQQDAVRWPGAPLAGAGRAVRMVPDLACAVVGAADLDPVLHAAATANQLTPWTSGGAEFGVVFRPLLPDESGC
jgi:hypothetical protein